MQSNRFQQYLDRYVGIPLCGLLSLFCRRVRVSHSPQKILFIQLSALGDTILAIPTIRAIRRTFPDAEITMLASRTNLTYLANCPYINKYILFEMPVHRMLPPLRRERFDWVIELGALAPIERTAHIRHRCPSTHRISDARTAPPFPFHRDGTAYPRTTRSPEFLGDCDTTGVSGRGVRSRSVV